MWEQIVPAFEVIDKITNIAGAIFNIATGAIFEELINTLGGEVPTNYSPTKLAEQFVRSVVNVENNNHIRNLIDYVPLSAEGRFTYTNAIETAVKEWLDSNNVRWMAENVVRRYKKFKEPKYDEENNEITQKQYAQNIIDSTITYINNNGQYIEVGYCSASFDKARVVQGEDVVMSVDCSVSASGEFDVDFVIRKHEYSFDSIVNDITVEKVDNENYKISFRADALGRSAYYVSSARFSLRSDSSIHDSYYGASLAAIPVDVIESKKEVGITDVNITGHLSLDDSARLTPVFDVSPPPSAYDIILYYQGKNVGKSFDIEKSDFADDTLANLSATVKIADSLKESFVLFDTQFYNIDLKSKIAQALQDRENHEEPEDEIIPELIAATSTVIEEGGNVQFVLDKTNIASILRKSFGTNSVTTTTQGDQYLFIATYQSAGFSIPQVKVLLNSGELHYLTGSSVSVSEAIGVEETNHPPVAFSQSITVGQDMPTSITIDGGDVDGDTLHFSYEQPTYGVLTGTSPNLTYTPANGYTGSDSFSFLVNDGVANSSRAVVTIDVVTAGPTYPTITLVDIPTTVQGNPVTFTANLAASLASEYSVKIRLGDAGGGYLAATDMSSNASRASFTYSVVINSPGNRVYQVAIYMGNTQMTAWQEGEYTIVEVGMEPTCTDADGDLYSVEGDDCGAVDCNDGDISVNPGATEACGDGIDNDCLGGDAVCPGEVNTVVSAGQVWMDRNLGASQVATSLWGDEAAYGDLYQWGRGADGHQVRTSGTTVDLSSTNIPGHGDFIIVDSFPTDWRNPQNDNLWQGGAGINNPCPSGFRLPTKIELEDEMASWSTRDMTGAFESPLKFVAAGMRGDGGTIDVGSGCGHYWSSTWETISDNEYSYRLGFCGGQAIVDNCGRACGLSVRCIEDSGMIDPSCTDADGDTYATEGGACGDVDCNDGVAAINPGATEICGDGVDNDCSGGDQACSAAGTVISAGQVWMDRNLGASRVATSSTDSAAYGDLYQWGRGTDGHQVRTSGTTSTNSSSDTPGHGDFILEPNPPYDWRSPQNFNLWQGVSGINNPCPSGFRLPTMTEWETERASWSSNYPAAAFDSPLKLVVPGIRVEAGLISVGFQGRYWSSSPQMSMMIDVGVEGGGGGSGPQGGMGMWGHSVRCIED